MPRRWKRNGKPVVRKTADFHFEGSDKQMLEVALKAFREYGLSNISPHLYDLAQAEGLDLNGFAKRKGSTYRGRKRRARIFPAHVLLHEEAHDYPRRPRGRPKCLRADGPQKPANAYQKRRRASDHQTLTMQQGGCQQKNITVKTNESSDALTGCRTDAIQNLQEELTFLEQQVALMLLSKSLDPSQKT